MMPISPEDRRTITLAAGTAALTALLTGAIGWGFEEMKRLLSERRAKRQAETQR